VSELNATNCPFWICSVNLTAREFLVGNSIRQAVFFNRFAADCRSSWGVCRVAD
jgi:hypothetical protein